MLVDNVANYPKTEIERRFLVAVFGDGLLTSNGETWRAHRKIMAPSFDPRSVASYAPIMAREAQAFRAHWDTAAEDSIVDIAKDMTGLTLKIIAQTMFSSDSEELAALIDDAVRRAQAALDVSLLDLAPFVSLLRSRSRERTMRRIFSGLDAALGGLIGEREANLDGAPADLLTRLIAAKDADTGARMTTSEVCDEVVTIFLAGHETTAVAMTWIWYLLSQHPAQEARLHAELDQVLVGRAPGPEDVARLPLYPHGHRRGDAALSARARRLQPSGHGRRCHRRPGRSRRRDHADLVVADPSQPRSSGRIPSGSIPSGSRPNAAPDGRATPICPSARARASVSARRCR